MTNNKYYTEFVDDASDLIDIRRDDLPFVLIEDLDDGWQVHYSTSDIDREHLVSVLYDRFWARDESEWDKPLEY